MTPYFQRSQDQARHGRGCRGQARGKAESKFIFKPKWALELPARSRRLSGRMEIGSQSGTCQETWRLPSGQGFRWLKARAMWEGSGVRGAQLTPQSPAPALPKEAVGTGG